MFLGKRKLFFVVFFALFLSPSSVFAALPGARSATISGDVFLGGDYIELGISQYGSFGTAQNKPAGFFGTAARNTVGMSSDLDGFDTGTDWRIDFFMPGSPEERWSVGYKIGGSPTVAANARAAGVTGIADTTTTNESEGNLLKATSVGTLNSNLRISQTFSFNSGDKFFKTVVLLENISADTTLDSVRFMRSFDPDNTVDKGGSYTTHNSIVYTHLAGDGKAVVQADTSNNNSDPVYTGTGGASGGTRAPIFFYSSDERARVNYHSGLNPGDVYTPNVYNTVNVKGASQNQDGAISIAFDVGTLTPGQTATVTYYTSLDERDFSEVEQEIQEDEAASAPVQGESTTQTATNSATISWTTDIVASSQIEYGLVPEYGFTTPEINTDPLVTEHEVTISDLKACARYFFRTKSTNVDNISSYSEQKTFATEGCSVSEIVAGVEDQIGTDGGTLSLSNDEVEVSLIVPENFHDRSASFQINKLYTYTIDFSVPTGKQILPNQLFDLIAVDEDGEQLTSFNSSVTFVVSYADLLDETIDEDTLDVYRYEDGVWVAQNCTLDKEAKTLTCSLPHFSVYAVFGDLFASATPTPTPTSTPTSSPTTTSSASSDSYCPSTWLGVPDLFQIDTTRDTATVYFTPVAESDEYFISYSTQPWAEEHGVQVKLSSEGVQSFKVQELLPKSTYYFKVRAIKGCVYGDWSNIKSAATTTPVNSISNLSKQAVAVPSLTPTPTPMIEVEEPGELHDLLIKVEDQGKPVSGVVVEVPDLGQAVTDSKGEVLFKDVAAGKQKFKLVRDAYAAEHEVEVTGPEKEFSVLVQLEMKQGLLPEWLWAAILCTLLLFFALFVRRSNKNILYEK